MMSVKITCIYVVLFFLVVILLEFSCFLYLFIFVLFRRIISFHDNHSRLAEKKRNHMTETAILM